MFTTTDDDDDDDDTISNTSTVENYCHWRIQGVTWGPDPPPPKKSVGAPKCPSCATSRPVSRV